MEELYNQKINEFVDWVSGENLFTGINETGGLKVSGAKIRELLQERLKIPFVLKEDKQNGKYRMFSSEYAYQLWLENPSDNSELEIFNFVRPSEYKLTFTGLNNSNKYIRYGDSESLDARIQYSWSISNDDGLSSENLQVTYTITNESTGKVKTFTEWYDAGVNVDFSIYSYLKPGRNSIVISGLGTQSGAKNSANFNIVVLELNVTSNFQFYNKFTNGTQIRIPCTFTRNDDSGTARVHYIIDAGKSSQQEWTTDVIAYSGISINAEKSIVLDLESGQHTLQIYAECSYNEGSVNIDTNLLYYTFVIATNEISTQKYICIGTNFNTGLFPLTSLTLSATQYMQSKLEWGYYTEALSSDSKITVAWKLYENEDDLIPTTLSTITASTQTKSPDLQFIPTIYSAYDQSSNPLSYISAQYNEQELLRIPIQILGNRDFNVYEVTPYALKLSAYGRTNESSDKNSWGDFETTFNGVQWNQNSGWYNNSLRLCGQNEYVTIQFSPFENFDINQSGKTIEIEFETEKIVNDNDVLVCFGNPNGGRIEITPTKASLYSNSILTNSNTSEIIHTNYKSNERLKLAFIINDVPPNQESRTQESGLAYIINNGILERAAVASGGQFQNSGIIKIGGSDSGIRVYNIRIYNYALTYNQSYNNFLYDSDNKAQIYAKNDIVGLGDKISYNLCKNKIDTILIYGDLQNLLNQTTLKDESTTQVSIERYCPFDTSKNFKINNVRIRKHGQSTLNYPVPSMKIWMNKSNTENVVPTFEVVPQEQISFGKNRYRMKSNSIPTNKFILQANYADSSGVHNGGLLRLMNDTWYNALINDKYLLRTEPQLFTSISSDDKSKYGLEHVWNDYLPNNQFPYKLQIAPDSFPCAVFYQDINDETQTFLGQYVFMEDKKSDFLYGERSIYKIPSDPFCLTTTHAKDDTKDNKIWDNGNVLRIEVIESNNVYSSYITSNGFTDIENIVNPTTNEITGRRYKWEKAFELIYPDPDDFEDDKFQQNSEFVSKVQPFINWYNWVISTKDNQQKFQNEASDHLDLYKMAAYYIFVLRFGLVDSLERNAQIKTYDGVHFHYEPWDMDIALGNKNDGGIAFDPPIDRNTKLSTGTYAISGKSANEETGELVTSNWLWDALENWSEWTNIIVPKVANALYTAGLTYDNICQMFDENYSEAWSETIYNKSGQFKYVESRGTDPEWLRWLQGARTTHRHWWLSTSMDYYDAKWFCGEYKQHSIYITANVSLTNVLNNEDEAISGNISSGKTIYITPNKDTYMVIQKDYTTIDTQHVTPNNPLQFVVPVMNTKNPFHVYGANFMESVDFNEIATGLDSVDFTGVYSNILGSPLKSINIGCPITANNSDYNIVLANLGGAIRGQATSFSNLQNLNIRGQQNFTSTNSFIRGNNITSLQNVYAMGSGLTDFYSSEYGNTFGTIELPSTINVFQMNDSTWNTLTFWDTNIISGSQARLSLHSTSIGDNQYSNIPPTISTIILNGTSCQDNNSILLVKNWLKSIVAYNGDLQNYTFKADKINWGATTVDNNNLLTFNELSLIAQMGTVDIKGYILLQNENNTSLTTQQLTQIKSWFGNSVFDRNSSGLIVDHNNSYIQINIGNAEGVSIINDEIYIKEGTRVSLNATQFLLAEQNISDYVWGIESVVQNTQHMCSIIDGQYTQDHITYLNVQESKIGGNYDIRIIVAVGVNQYSTVVHIIGVTYPENAYLKCDSKTNNIVRETSSYIEFYDSGMSADIYVNSDEQYTATIDRIEYTISKDNNVVQYNKKTGGNNFQSWIQTLELGIGQKGLLCTWPGALPTNDEIEYYTIQATITFMSNKQVTVSKQLIVMQDNQAIITSINTVVYGVLSNSWNTEYNTQLPTSVYRIHLLSLHGELDFSVQINEQTLGSNIATNNRRTLLKYIPNVTSLIFDGCNALTFTSQYVDENNGKQIMFDYMPNLQKLSIQNCTRLDQDIDLTMCPNIQEIDASGTTINVILPNNPKITKYELGTPTSINISNPTVLQPSGVNVDVSTSINSLDIVNIPDNKSFTMFAKIINIS